MSGNWDSSMGLKAFLTGNYVETLGILPVLTLLMLLAFIVHIDRYIRADLKKTMRIIILLLFSLIAQNYLDPTMVGEVQAVIRDLAKTGKTMMIVTHEMNFAKAISNRVFFMDEGGIYEDGTPEQIFERPQRENTRRFIKKLKVLELNIESRDYDFLGMAGQIEAYCNKNQIAPRTSSRIQLAFEESAQMLVSMIENPRIQAVCEYSEATETAEWMVSYGGQRLDVTNIGDELALSVLKGITDEMKFIWNENAELPNQLILRIQRA